MEVGARVGRRIAVEGKVAGLGANQNFIAMQSSGPDQLLQDGPDIAFRALVPVINCGIEDIYSRPQAHLNRRHVGLIGGIAGGAEIRSQPDGGKPKVVDSRHMLSLAEVAGITQIGKTIAIPGGAGGGSMSCEQVEIL
jgi:hypothetical protein